MAPPASQRKVCEPDRLVEKIASLPRPLVFTNGVFDILHRGHVTYLDRARALGASLLVAANTDASVRRLGKGGDRPIHRLADRTAVLAALAAVDLVTWFDADTPYDLILACHPDILVKGGDWKVEEIVSSREVLGWGGKVYSIPFEHQRSTTDTIAKIRAG